MKTVRIEVMSLALIALLTFPAGAEQRPAAAEEPRPAARGTRPAAPDDDRAAARAERIRELEADFLRLIQEEKLRQEERQARLLADAHLRAEAAWLRAEAAWLPGYRPVPPDGPNYVVINPQQTQMANVREYLDMVTRFSELTDDPTKAGVAAVLAANDMLRDRPRVAIDYFERILPEVQNPSVQRAIRLQLIEHYKTQNNHEGALRHLQEFMTDAPAPGAAARRSGVMQPRPQPSTDTTTIEHE